MNVRELRQSAPKLLFGSGPEGYCSWVLIPFRRCAANNMVAIEGTAIYLSKPGDKMEIPS